MSLNIPWGTVRSIIVKWKQFGTTKTLPRSGRPSKVSSRGLRKLLREVTVRPKITLKELQRSLAEIGENVDRSTISQT
ncbi:UNVERIFIED_CONTAM: hypothetical protein FKN15_060879 [Acipenser sinensis]